MIWDASVINDAWSTLRKKLIVSKIKINDFSRVLFIIPLNSFFTGGMEMVSGHTFCIAKYFHYNLSHLHHDNGMSVAEIYCNGNFQDPSTQGAVVNFNLMRANGMYIGFAEVRKSVPRAITLTYSLKIFRCDVQNLGKINWYFLSNTLYWSNYYSENHLNDFQ